VQRAIPLVRSRDIGVLVPKYNLKSDKAVAPYLLSLADFVEF